MMFRYDHDLRLEYAKVQRELAKTISAAIQDALENICSGYLLWVNEDARANAEQQMSEAVTDLLSGNEPEQFAWNGLAGKTLVRKLLEKNEEELQPLVNERLADENAALRKTISHLQDMLDRRP
jgi:hypothetical protein